jgi:hypothetical protein
MSNDKIIGWTLLAIGVTLLALALSSCASSGLYAMSDEWCEKHPDASPARCNRNPLKEYDIQGHQPVGPEWSMCPGQYTYGVYGVTITCWGNAK